MEKRLGRFERYVLVICMLVAVAFLLQLGVNNLQLDSPTGALITDLQDFFELVGPPSSVTKIVTGVNPTSTAEKIAEYYASDHVLCGNGVKDEDEDCEPYFSEDPNMGVQELLATGMCLNCKICGDGKVGIDTSTNTLEECDPGDVNFIPSIPAQHTCTNNGQCQVDCTCPVGTQSTNVCAFGIYDDIKVDAITYTYQYTQGNTICEQGESSNSIDCALTRTKCGVTLEELIRFEGGSQVEGMTKQELVALFVQEEMPIPVAIASILFDAPFLNVFYQEGEGGNGWTLKITKFPDSNSLLEVLNATYLNPQFFETPTNFTKSYFNGRYVYIDNRFNRWIWYSGDVLFVLKVAAGSGVEPLILTMAQKQQTPYTDVLITYLNKFGSNVGATTPPPSCGNSNIESGEQCDDGNVVTETCGDSTVQSGSYCKADCTQVLTLTEQCDDGNTNSGDGCSADCQIEAAVCDNDKICETGETATNCAGDCLNLCGASSPSCDTGEGYDNCQSDCPFTGCNNDNVCDPGEGTICVNTNDCPYNMCGNHLCESGETPATCADCLINMCGNRVWDTASEMCDDGNVVTETCGDSTVQSGSYCKADCTQVLTLTEQCDDGNTNSGDGCSATCQVESLVCTETDNGAELFVQGTTSHLGTVNTDYCIDETHLTEYWCSAGGTAISSQIVDCVVINKAGCSNGACV